MQSTNLLKAALVLALATGAGSGMQPAAAATTTAVPNPSFDAGWSGGKLTCWNVAGTGQAKLTVTRNGHNGQAAFAAGLGPAGARVKLTTDRTGGCTVPVAAGETYRLGFWLRATGDVRPVVYTYSPIRGWAHWFTGTRIPAGALAPHVIALPAVPAGVTSVSVGIAFDALSTVVLDDVSLTLPPGRALFRSSFPLTDGLVTNEFAYWSPTNPRRADSADWAMTSGSLFARDGNGYTGRVDDIPADALSQAGTNSAIFRLTTRDRSFTNVAVRLNLDVHTLSSTSTTPKADWDGVHVFLHYKSQYELYYASVARRDGKVVIKKKCRGGPTNGGSYYPLSAEVRGLAIPYGSWMNAGASIRDNSDGSVTVSLSRNGRTVVTATDRGLGCAPITGAGATGIRGDNARFEFDGFTVTSIA